MPAPARPLHSLRRSCRRFSKKPKSSGGVIRQGTKVKNIRLVDAGHDIDRKIEGFGAMNLKPGFARKA